ncbi:MAG: hypothetical protein ACYTHM_20770 [Planctomycetota bacterium]|jgi:hypothetical protein
MHIILIPAIPLVVWAIIAAFLMARELEKRGHEVSFIWMRLMIFKYIHQYTRVTREETGRVGPLLYHYVIPLNLALVLVIVFAVLKGFG